MPVDPWRSSEARGPVPKGTGPLFTIEDSAGDVLPSDGMNLNRELAKEGWGLARLTVACEGCPRATEQADRPPELVGIEGTKLHEVAGSICAVVLTLYQIGFLWRAGRRR